MQCIQACTNELLALGLTDILRDGLPASAMALVIIMSAHNGMHQLVDSIYIALNGCIAHYAYELRMSYAIIQV